MASAELRVAVRHPLVVARHPKWWWAFMTDGREGVMRRVMEEDLAAIRSESVPASLEHLTEHPPSTILGRVGSPQEYLYRITRWLKPAIVVETGVDRGLSSAFILAGIQDNGAGRLFSIDLPTARYVDPATRKTTVSNVGSTRPPGYAIPPDLRSAWTLILGDSRTALPELLARVGQIDMFVHDSEHTYELMTEEYRLALEHLRPGGMLLSDDVNWNRAFPDLLTRGGFDFSTTLLGRLGVARLGSGATYGAGR